MSTIERITSPDAIRKSLQPADCVSEGVRVGYDVEQDLARGFSISESGAVLAATAESIELLFAESI